MVMAPLVFFGVAEVALRWIGFGYPTAFFLRRTIEGRAVLMTNPEFGKRFFASGLARPPRPGVMSVEKAAGTRRILVFGESAAMGDPDPRFGMPRMLEVLLRERFPDRPIEVVNAAVVAISSHVIRPIARECAVRDGDVWVVYMGNNEMIGPFGPITAFGWQSPPVSVVRASLAVKATRVGQGLEALTRGVLGLGVGRREWGGMSMMADQRLGPADPRRVRAYAHFEANLEGILDAAKRAGARVVLCTVATNLRDCAPFASVHRPGLSAAGMAVWEEGYRLGIQLEERGEWAAAAAAYRGASEIDDSFADLAFRRARCFERLGNAGEAARWLARARDCDALPFRADGRINQAIRSAARRHAGAGVELLDVEELFATRSPDGLVGREMFYEHVHFTPAGNHVLACAVAERVTRGWAGGGGGESEGRIGAGPGLPNGDGVEAPPKDAVGPWLGQPGTLRRLGFNEWHRHQISLDVLGRVRAPPFTGQLEHEREVAMREKQIEATRWATKPTAVRRAVDQVREVAEGHPEEPDLRWVLAELWEVEGSRARAEEEWRAVIRQLPLAITPAYNLGRLLELGERYDEASVVYAACLRIDPEHTESRVALGRVQGRGGR